MFRAAALIGLIMIGLMAFAFGAPSTDQSKEDASNTAASAKPPVIVTLDAKGADLRDVIHTMFEQVKADYVLDQNVRGIVYLALRNVPLERAISVLSENNNLQFNLKDGLYLITVKPKTAPQPELNIKPAQVNALSKVVYLTVDKQPIAQVTKTLSEQTSAQIQLDADVPAYLVSMSIQNKTLKFALNALRNAAPLTYSSAPDGSIHIHLKTLNIIESSGSIGVKESRTSALKYTCRKCHHAVAAGWHWCPYCGKCLMTPLGKRL